MCAGDTECACADLNKPTCLGSNDSPPRNRCIRLRRIHRLSLVGGMTSTAGYHLQGPGMKALPSDWMTITWHAHMSMEA